MSELELLKRRIKREIAARKAAEALIESKSLDLYRANQKLVELNQILESKVEERTQQLTKSEEQYRVLVESARDIIYNADPEGYIIYSNEMVERILGYAREEIIGRHFTDYVIPDKMEEVMNFYIKMRDEHREDSYLEIPVINKHNALIWLGQNVRRVELNNEVVFSIVARDITERKKVESALEKARKSLSLSEQKYRSMIENMKLGILEVDLDGKVIKAYDGFCEMVEYTPEELTGLNPESFLLNVEARKIITAQHHLREKGKAEIYEIPIITKTGKRKWMLISGAPFYNLNDEIIGSIGIHYDITYQKELQKQLEIARANAESAQEAEKEFLANMSHEIRTPLNAIIGMSHLLNDTVLDTEQKEFLTILSNSANLLHTLISDILDISKIDAGHINKKMEPTNLPAILHIVQNSFSIKAREKGISLELLVDEQINTELQSDHLLLNQILINLVGNAVKFTQDGSVKIEAIKESDDGNEVAIRIIIEDTGIGISDHLKPVIFEKFRQATNRMDKKYVGTGLGLSITKSLVQILGGTIHFESSEGKGTRFEVLLPFKNLHRPLQSTNYLALQDELGNFRNCSILIAEDNLMNQKYISTLMNKWNISFDIVENGIDAVDLARKNVYDIIFMDLQMPLLNGLDATEQILADSINQQTPIIALTASTFLTKKQTALQSGMSEFLSKPFTPVQLSNIIQQYIRLGTDRVGEDNDSFKYSEHLDDKVLNEIYGDDLNYALEMFTIFLNQYQDEWTILEQAIMEDNYSKIMSQSHKLKPTYKMVGMAETSELLAKLEVAASNKSKKKVLELKSLITKILSKQIPVVLKQKMQIAKYLESGVHEKN